jgi:two-component system, response regulator
VNKRPILLVEDNPDDEELTLRTLRQTQINNEIIVVRDGEAALEFLYGTGRYAGRDRSVLPQLILLDLKLPKIGGLELLEHIRRQPAMAVIPVVVLSSSNEEGDIIASYHLGANSYVRKPVDYQRFAYAVQQLGIYWLLLNEPMPDLSQGR